MDIKLNIEEPRNVPLLPNTPPCDPLEKNNVHCAMSQTFKSTSDLMKHLPTGTVLTFQLLSPVFASQDECDTISQVLIGGLIALCAIVCFVVSFTDSFKNKRGALCYGFATPDGMWIIDGPDKLPPELAERYQLRTMDFVHAFMSVLVFLSIALLNQTAVNCIFPKKSPHVKEILEKLPLALGTICGMMFVAFPTHRHGIGCPFDHNQLTHTEV